MRIGARLLDQHHHHHHANNGGSNVRYVNKTIKKKRTCYKRIIKRAVPPIPAVLQELFDVCRDIFKGSDTVPSPEDVVRLSRILDDMAHEDVGISRNLDFLDRSSVKGTPRSKCTTIYKCKNFSLCLFFLPSSGVIPLHNHPGMTVFSKLLVGSMHIKSYDWADSMNCSNGTEPANVRLAKVQVDDTFTAPCSSSVLYPTRGGNIHAFTAKTPCAILDVIGPPYSSEDGREESYYKDYPYSTIPKGEMECVSKEEAASYAWLEEIAVPESSQMDEIEYFGPPVGAGDDD